MKCFEYGPGCNILNTSFSLQLINVPNKLECLSIAILSSVVFDKTLAYWDHL